MTSAPEATFNLSDYASEKDSNQSTENGLVVTLNPQRPVSIFLRLFLPRSQVKNNRVVIVAPATGVPQRTYKRFCRYLADRGVVAVSLDYRGIAESRPTRLKGFNAGLPQWADDISCVIRWVESSFKNSKISLVGHSIGGFLPLIADDCIRLDKMVTVGAQTAYWKDWPASRRIPLFLIWHGLMPLTTLLTGYFPGKRFGLGEDLPYQVARGWGRRWKDPGILHQMPADFIPVPVNADIFAIRSTDDDFATASAVERMHKGYTQAKVQLRVVQPGDHGQKSIGHFGYFKPGMEALWQEIYDWLMSD